MEEVKGQAGAENQNEQNNKILKAFDNTMNKVVAILGGKDQLNPKRKVQKDVLQTVVSELLKEDKEASQLAIKNELKELLSKHVTLKKEIKAKEEEFEKLKLNKMKEFNEAASKLFNKIDNLDGIEKDWIESLKAAGDKK